MTHLFWGKAASTAAFAVSLLMGCGENTPSEVHGAALGLDDREPERDLRVVPEPQRVSEEEVRADLDALDPGDPERVGDYAHLLRAYRSVQTSLAEQWLTVHAVSIAMNQPRVSSHAFLRRLARAEERSDVRLSLTEGLRSTAECHVGFDTHEVLDSLPDQAQATLALDPYYYKPCRTGSIRVEPLRYGHYHLLYEDPTIACVDDNGRFGRGEWDDCTALEDPAAEPRLVGSHTGNQVIRIWYGAGGGRNLPLPFSLQSFVNVGEEPVKVRYRRTTGEWFEWPSLAGNTMWMLSPHANDVDEILITNAGTSLDCGGDFLSTASGCPVAHVPFFVDDLAIDP